MDEAAALAVCAGDDGFPWRDRPAQAEQASSSIPGTSSMEYR
jgi:hypothetical protein